MMRIITGKARGVRLDTLPGVNTRPTAERAKEAVFSMLQFEMILGVRELGKSFCPGLASDHGYKWSLLSPPQPTLHTH